MDTTTQFMILGILVGMGIIAMIVITINSKSEREKQKMLDCELTEEDMRAHSHIPTAKLLSDMEDAERLLKHYEELIKDPNPLIRTTARFGHESTRKMLKIYTQLYEYRKKHK